MDLEVWFVWGNKELKSFLGTITVGPGEPPLTVVSRVWDNVLLPSDLEFRPTKAK